MASAVPIPSMRSLPWRGLAATIDFALASHDTELRENADEIIDAARSAISFAEGRDGELLNEAQIAAVNLYTHHTVLHRIVNQRLRAAQDGQLVPGQLAPLMPYIKLLLSALYRLPPVDKLIYRGVQADMGHKLQRGTETTWWAFSSASEDLEVIQRFVGKERRRVLFHIQAETAVNIGAYSEYPNEAELLVLPGTTFSVGAVANLGGGVMLVTLKEMAASIRLPLGKEPSYARAAPARPLTARGAPARGAPATPAAAAASAATVSHAAIARELVRRTQYPFRECAQMVLDGCGSTTYLQGVRQLERSQQLAHRAVGLYGLSRCTADDMATMATSSGHAHALNRQELLREALRCDPRFNLALVGLSGTISGRETVVLADGRRYRDRDLCILALANNPRDGNALGALIGIVDDGGECVQLHDGRRLNKRDLCVEMLALDPNNARVYCDLGCLMSAKKTVTLHDGRRLDKQALLIEALRLDPTIYDANMELVELLKDGSCTIGGRRMDSVALCLAAQAAKPAEDMPYLCLGRLVSEEVTLRDGRTMTSFDLFCEALCSNPENVEAMLALAPEMDSGQRVNINGRFMSARQLLNEAIAEEPDHERGYALLAFDLGNPRQEITLRDGRVMRRADLCAEAVRCGTSDVDVFFTMVDDMRELGYETYEIEDGDERTVLDFLLSALRRDTRNAECYCRLADTLQYNETIYIDWLDLDARAEDLLLLALKYNAKSSWAYRSLADIMDSTYNYGETMKLPNGQWANAEKMRRLADKWGS